jgi:predicted ester cyclase
MRTLRMLVPSATIMSLLVGCQGKEAIAELEAMKARAEIEEQNTELMKQYYVELDDTDIGELGEFVAKFVSPDFVLHLPGGVDIIGTEALKEYYVGTSEAFPDAVHTIDDVIAEGDKIAFRATTRGIHRGEFMGIPPTGNDVTITFDGFCQIRDGKIVEWWSEWDALGLMTQLGMELTPSEGEQ